MVVSGISSSRRTELVRYGFALLVNLLALLSTWLLLPITSQAPFLCFSAAVVVSALYGGWKPMLLVAVLGVITIGYFFIPPVFSLALGLEGILELGVFALVAGVTGFLAERHNRTAHNVRTESEQLRVTLASIGDAVIVTDTRGSITFMNAMAEALTGWSATEAIGTPSTDVFQIVNATTREVVESPITHVLREGTIVGLANHTVLLAKDGTERPIDDSGAPVRAADGSLIGVVLVFRDVTERERADAAMRAARDQLDVILRGVADGITAQTSKGQLIYINDAAAQTSGFPSAEAMLATPPAAILERFEMLDEAGEPFPVDRLPGRQALRGVASPEALIRFRNRATGEERWSLVKATAVGDPSGQGQLAINIMHDVTARRQAEEAQARLLASEQAARQDAERARGQVRQILESITDGFLAFDRDWHFTYANEAGAQTLGRSIESLLGTHLWAEFPELADTSFGKLYQRAMDEGVVLELEEHYPPFNAWFSVRAYPSASGLSLYFRDVTARRMTEQALRTSEERLQTALQAAKMVAWEWDLATGALVYADTALTTLGITPEQQQTTAEANLALVHPADLPALEATIAAAIAQRGAYQAEFRWMQGDPDAVTWLEVHGQVSTDSADIPVRISGVVTDITERKRADAERTQLLATAQAASADAAAARAQLEALLERITDAVFAVDREWRYTYVNTQATRLTRKTREELIGNQIWEVFPDTVGGLSDRELRRAVQEQRPVAFENSNARLNVWGETRAYPSAEGLTIFTRDITLQKQSEQVAQQTAVRTARLQTVTAALVGALTPGEIATVVLREGLAAVDGNAGSIVLLTPTGDEMEMLHAVGYPAEVIDQYRHLSATEASPAADTVRGNAPIFIENRAAAIARWPYMAAVHEVIPWQAWVNLPLLVDGQAIGNLELAFLEEQEFGPEVRSFLLTLAQQCSQALERARLYEAERQARTHAERIQRRVSFLADVTTRLTASLEYTTRLQQLAHLVVPTLADFCVVYVQQANGWITPMALAHSDPVQEARLQVLEAQDPIDPDGPDPIARVLRSGEAEIVIEMPSDSGPSSAQGPAQQADQQIQPHAYMLFPLAARSQFIGAMSFMLTDPARSYSDEDVTFAAEVARRAALALDNARLYSDAQAAIQLRDQFLSVAAHELKTPLTSLLGNAQLIQRRDQRENLLRPQERRNIEVIVNQANRLNAMVLSLLDVSRMEAGQLSIQREPLDLCGLVRRIVEEAGSSLENRALELIFPDELILVSGDALRLEQVFQNLIQNAVKYSAPPEPITVEVVKRGSVVTVAFRDKGIGIPSEAISRLFQRFFRASNVNATNVVGMGIGLYVVREIVTLHGGTVEVVSTEGVGSTFTVTLPLAETSNSQANS